MGLIRPVKTRQIVDFILSFVTILVLCVRLGYGVTVSVTPIRKKTSGAGGDPRAGANRMQETGVWLPVEAS